MVLPFQVALFSGVSVAALMASAGADAYAVGGNAPEFVADFAGTLNSGTEYYRSGGSDTTFSSVFTHSGLVLPATMTDSDGVLKWAPHNLVLNSASPATQSITVVSGADYTVEITGSGSVALSGAGSGTVTAGNPVEITASTTSLTLTVTGSPTTMWAYRSDLGGMVNNPDTSSTYVATTGSAKFRPRRNHYLYNGSTYDNAGILIESAAATNLATYSNTFTNAAWSTNAANETLTASASTGPDGATSMTRLNDDSGTGTGEVYVDQAVTVATSTAYTFSVYAKADQLSWIALGAENFTTPANGESFFNLSAGTVGTAATGHTARIENVASGIYRCSITFTTDASDTSGNIRIYVADADTDITVDRDGTSSVYIYGAQFEAGSVPTSYIPVVAGSTVTRAAETLTVAGSSLPANTTAMSIHTSGKMTYADTGASDQVYQLAWNLDASNYIRYRVDCLVTRTGQQDFLQNTAATLDLVETSATYYSPGVNVAYNIAGRHTSSAINGATDGVALTENATPTALADLSSANMSLSEASASAVGYTKSISIMRMWGTDIGDSGIETAST